MAVKVTFSTLERCGISAADGADKAVTADSAAVVEGKMMEATTWTDADEMLRIMSSGCTPVNCEARAVRKLSCALSSKASTVP